MGSNSATQQLLVTHLPGIHARPSLSIVQTVRRFRSKVTIGYAGREADAGEILGVMSLGVPQGSQVTLSAHGPDAEEVVAALAKLFADDFGMSGD